MPRYRDNKTYPGLDITAGVFPFVPLRRDGAAADIGSGGSLSDNFWRFVRLGETTFTASGSGAGLGSRGGTLRFRDDVCDRVGTGVAADPKEEPEEPEGSDELAARLVEARVILEDMSTCIEMDTFSKLPAPPHNFVETVVRICGRRDEMNLGGK
jgi:hypothetical protein